MANSLTVGNIYIAGNSIGTTSGAVDFTSTVNFKTGVRGTILALNYHLLR